jgi:hypothetical protein
VCESEQQQQQKVEPVKGGTPQLIDENLGVRRPNSKQLLQHWLYSEEEA